MADTKSTKIIDSIPNWGIALLANGLGAYYRMNRYSSKMRSTLEEWRKLEGYDRKELEAYQIDRLRYIARVANTTVYYKRVFKEVGFDPENITSLDDLKRVPVLGKDELRQYGADMVVTANKAPRIQRHSSGTTGQPVTFYQPKRMVFAQGYAMLYQFYSWFGFSPLGRRASMAGRYMGHKPRGVVMQNYFENQLLLGVHSLSETSVQRYLHALDRFSPELFQAHPSALLMLKNFAEQTGQRPPVLPLVSYTGENMTEHERQELSQWLGGAKIFGTYGSGENVIAASESPDFDGYHVHPAIGLCELEQIDGKNEILGTSLLNDAMPLLRYRTGDLAEHLTSEPSASGRCWQRLNGIQGRVDEHLTAANGSLVAPVVFRTGIAALGKMQAPYSIIQHAAKGTFTFLIYDDPLQTHDEDVKAVVKYLKSILGDESQISVKYVPQEELLTARAKHRIVIKEKAAQK